MATSSTLEVRTLSAGNKDRNEEALTVELLRLERRIFPKHESLADSFHHEIARRNVVLLYVLQDHSIEGYSSKLPPVAGYLIFSVTSLVLTVTKLAVRENCRRKGYGEALMKAALEKASQRRVMCVNLHVDPQRAAALSLYQKLGFKVDSLVQSYYAPARDAFRMVLNLEKD